MQLLNRLVLLANGAGKIRAIGAICTHEQENLADGDELDQGCVICPMHFARFDLMAGAAVEGPAQRPEPAYEVRVEGGRILVGPEKP